MGGVVGQLREDVGEPGAPEAEIPHRESATKAFSVTNRAKSVTFSRRRSCWHSGCRSKTLARLTMQTTPAGTPAPKRDTADMTPTELSRLAGTSMGFRSTVVSSASRGCRASTEVAGAIKLTFKTKDSSDGRARLLPQ
jgi:hypothetical protein